MKWVTMYSNAQSIVPPHPATYAKNITLRYPIYVPFNGNKIRINFDNNRCDEDVEIKEIFIGKGSSLSDKQVNPIPLKYQGKTTFKIPAHKEILSDELNIDLKENEYLIISMYFENFVKLTSGVDIKGPLSKGFFAYNNQAKEEKLDINTSKSTTWVYLLSNINIYTDDNNFALICYGDSITSQSWPDYMQIHLKNKGINNYAVIRKAISGTRILRQYECITYQSYGLSGKNRFEHEIIPIQGANKIIIQHGINDIIHPVGVDINIFRPMSDLPTCKELIDGIEYYINICKKLSLDFYVGNLLPIYNWRTFNLEKEHLKNTFNEQIKLNYKCIDFEAAIGDLKDNIYRFKNDCDSGDHLHPSEKAYELMALEAIKTIFNK